MSPLTAAVEDTLNGLPDDRRGKNESHNGACTHQCTYLIHVQIQKLTTEALQHYKHRQIGSRKSETFLPQDTSERQ